MLLGNRHHPASHGGHIRGTVEGGGPVRKVCKYRNRDLVPALRGFSLWLPCGLFALSPYVSRASRSYSRVNASGAYQQVPRHRWEGQCFFTLDVCQRKETSLQKSSREVKLSRWFPGWEMATMAHRDCLQCRLEAKPDNFILF